MYMNMMSLENTLAELSKETAKQTESIMLEQLGDFASKGLIVLEQMGPIIVQEPHSDKLSVQTKVRLVLKDKEYIESLENQIEELNDLISKLRGKS